MSVVTPLSPLALQRLLLGVLVLVMLVSLGLFFSLERTSTRRADPVAARGAAESGSVLGAEPAPTEPPTLPPAESAEATRAAFEREAPLGAESEIFDPAAVCGRVVADEQPLEAVELWLFPGWQERRERVAPLARERTGADGRFAFRDCQPFASYVVCLQHPDYLPSQETLVPGHAEELELEPSASVEGVVRSAETQAPIAGARIGVQRWYLGESGPEESVSTETDAEGRFRLRWAQPGIERFQIQRAGYLSEEREFQVGAEGGSGYEIWLSATPRLELELYALENGAALADTELLSDQVRVRTDALGRLRLAAAPGGSTTDPVRLSLALEEGCVTQGRVDPSAVRGFMRVPVARGGTIQGRVIDAEGSGVAAAAVRVSGGGRFPSSIVLPEGFWLNPPRAVARADAEGRFTLRGMPPREGQVELRAHHPAHPSGRSEPFWFAELGASANMDVRLARASAVEGNVRKDGVPAALRVFWNGEGGGGWTRANDRGDYRLEGLPSGEINLRARLDHEDEDSERPEDVAALLEEGKTLRVDFELFDRHAWIRGRVLDARGAPVARAAVRATPSEESEEWLSEEPRAESEADGTFALAVPDQDARIYDVWAESGPRRARAQGVSVGEQRLELVLPAMTTLNLRVVDALRHEPVSGFQIYWRESEAGQFERLVQGGRRFAPGPDGSFQAELPMERLDLLVSARSQGFVYELKRDLDLLGALPESVTFELERGVVLTLSLVLPEGNAAAWSQLQRGRVSLVGFDQDTERERGGDFFQQEVKNAQALRFDANKEAQVRALPAGRYHFLGTPKGFAFEPAQFELPAVAEHRLELRLVEAKKPKPGAGGGD